MTFSQFVSFLCLEIVCLGPIGTILTQKFRLTFGKLCLVLRRAFRQLLRLICDRKVSKILTFSENTELSFIFKWKNIAMLTSLPSCSESGGNWWNADERSALIAAFQFRYQRRTPRLMPNNLLLTTHCENFYAESYFTRYTNTQSFKCEYNETLTRKM